MWDVDCCATPTRSVAKQEPLQLPSLAKYRFAPDVGFLPELLDQVFFWLSDDGPEAKHTLVNCSVVSMAWAELSLKHRFYHIYKRFDRIPIPSFGYVPPSDIAFTEFLRSSPRVNDTVKKLTLRWGSVREMGPEVLEVLDLLPSLRQLILLDIPRETWFTPITLQPRDSRHALRRRPLTVQIVNTKMEWPTLAPYDLFSFLLILGGVEKLIIHGFAFNWRWNASWPRALRYGDLKLTSLTIDSPRPSIVGCGRGALAFLSCPSLTASLKHLRISGLEPVVEAQPNNPVNWDLSLNAVRNLGARLESLNLELPVSALSETYFVTDVALN